MGLGRTKGTWAAKEQAVKSCWISKATVRTSESSSVSSSVLPLWTLAFRQSSPRRGGWMGEKSENTSQAVRGPSLKTGRAGRGRWPQLPCEPSDLCPLALFRPARELEAAAGDPAHNVERVETPGGIRISVWKQKPGIKLWALSLPLCESAMGTPSQEA